MSIKTTSSINVLLIYLKYTLVYIQKQPPEVFCEKGVLRNFTKFTRKHLCQSLFFNKVAGLRHTTLVKKRLWHRYFPVNLVKFLRTSFFTEHFWTTASVYSCAYDEVHSMKGFEITKMERKYEE